MKEIADQILEELAALPHKKATLAVVLVGENPASMSYVRTKRHACTKVGVNEQLVALPASVSQEELLATIDRLNANPTVTGVLVQLPLPKQIDTQAVLERIDPNKDMDGLHPVNMGKLLLGRDDGYVPCTPLGIIELLKRKSIPLLGQEVVIVGRSNIVGKPLSILMTREHATVTLCHSKTKDLQGHFLRADIIVAAIGVPHFVKDVKKGAVVIDVGINRVEDSQLNKGYRLVGDVDHDVVHSKCSFITPVPGGIGPMTVAMLMKNCCR